MFFLISINYISLIIALDLFYHLFYANKEKNNHVKLIFFPGKIDSHLPWIFFFFSFHLFVYAEVGVSLIDSKNIIDHESKNNNNKKNMGKNFIERCFDWFLILSNSTKQNKTKISRANTFFPTKTPSKWFFFTTQMNIVYFLSVLFHLYINLSTTITIGSINESIIQPANWTIKQN